MEEGGLDKKILEEAFRNASNPVLGHAGPGVNPRTRFHDKFQREVEEHDQDLDKKYDEDLNTTLIFSGLFSAVASAFIIDIQSELSPDYQQLNNALLEMLLNATTGTNPTGSTTPVPRRSGPNPVVVQVQSILYATLFAALLAAFLAMLGKQWLNRYRQNEFRGSPADRNRLRERKLTGLEAWKFHIVMEFLPLILQCALALLGFALSRYLWEVNPSVSSVVIGFTCFVFLFYSFTVIASVLSSNCPFQTPLSLLIRFVIGLAFPYWRSLLQTFRSRQQQFQLGKLQARFDLPLSMEDVGGGHESEADLTLPPLPITPLFIQEKDLESERLDARCIDRLFEMSTDGDVVTSIMDFIPEVVWHDGIKRVPLERIYNILMDCFDFSGPHPVVVPKSRDTAYLSAKAFVHIELQRRCIAQHEERNQDSWKALCASHRLLSSADHGSDSDLAAALSMVDMTLGYDVEFPKSEMTPLHHAWMSHVFLYRAWSERRVPEVVVNFVENSLSSKSPSDTVKTDCFLIVGLTVGVTFHVNDITVKVKSRKKKSIIGNIFRALVAILSSESIQVPPALRALRLITQLSDPDVQYASRALFKTIMASDNPEDQHWEAARLAVRGAAKDMLGFMEQPGNILKFLYHHICLHGAGKDHGPDIAGPLQTIFLLRELAGTDPLASESAGDFDWTSQSFVAGVRSMMRPDGFSRLPWFAVGLTALLSDRWFDCSVPVMEPEQRREFCEHMARFMEHVHHDPGTKKWSVTILFGMLRSPEWRSHIVTQFWGSLAYCPLVEELESVTWCLGNAIELLEFTRGLPDGEGLKWWYWTLWFHYDRLDTTALEEVKKIAVDMRQNDGLSDLNLYLNLIQEEVSEKRKRIDTLVGGQWPIGVRRDLRARLVALEGNYDQLARIIAGR